MINDLYLILGCHGLKEEDLICCPALENNILIINQNLNGYINLIDYLDTVGLFDKPVLDINSLRHIIRNIYDSFDQFNKKIWSEHKYAVIQQLIHNHKKCGLYLRLDFEEKKQEVKSKQISFFIPKSKK